MVTIEFPSSNKAATMHMLSFQTSITFKLQSFLNSKRDFMRVCTTYYSEKYQIKHNYFLKKKKQKQRKARKKLREQSTRDIRFHPNN